MKERRLSITLEKKHETIFVGDILRRDLEVSSAVIRRVKWLPHGILVNGNKVHTRHFGKEGDILSILIGETTQESRILPVYGPLNIVYEDDDFLTIHKDAGVVVHPTHAHKDDTLGNFLLYYYRAQGFEGDFHPVHRLDRGTSGLLVVAKHPYAQERFKKQLHSPQFQREYLALVWGKSYPPVGTVNAPILTTDQMKRLVHPDGLPAVTHHQRLATGLYRGREISLVALTLETGRTHQIRVHLSHLGHPLLGDALYGQGDVLDHCALHAYRLSFAHPVTKEPLSFTAKPPQDFCAVMAEAQLPLPDIF